MSAQTLPELVCSSKRVLYKSLSKDLCDVILRELIYGTKTDGFDGKVRAVCCKLDAIWNPVIQKGFIKEEHKRVIANILMISFFNIVIKKARYRYDIIKLHQHLERDIYAYNTKVR